MEKAKVRYIRAYRGRILEQDVANWQRAARIREFCDAAKAKFSTRVGGSAQAFAEWMSWARDYAHGIDFVGEPPTVPADPEDIPREELKPFLGGWSPYGPDHSRW